MKKIVLTIAALLIFAATVYAGDIPEGLITNDSAKIFTATVTDVNSEAVTLKVISKNELYPIYGLLYCGGDNYCAAY